MRSAALAALLLALSAAPALAAPGDPMLAQGTLVWPPALAAQRVVILRADDGRIFYADVATARRQTTPPITAGMRVAFVGVEGAHPRLIRATAFGSGDVAALALSVATARASTTSRSASAGGAAGSREIRGVIRAADRETLTIEASDGAMITVDVSGVRRIPDTVKPGATVGVIGVPVAITVKATRVVAVDRGR